MGASCHVARTAGRYILKQNKGCAHKSKNTKQDNKKRYKTFLLPLALIIFAPY